MACGHCHTFVNRPAEGYVLMASQPIGQASSAVVPQPLTACPLGQGQGPIPVTPCSAGLSVSRSSGVGGTCSHTHSLAFVSSAECHMVSVGGQGLLRKHSVLTVGVVPQLWFLLGS